MAERFSTGHVNARCEEIAADYAGGVLAIFGGAAQPASADAAEAGTLLCLVTNNGLEHTPGSTTNGLEFGAPVDGAMGIKAGQTWQGTVLPAAGVGMVATYFRFYDKDHITGASTTAKRFDGAISPSSASELSWTNTTLVAGAPFQVQSFPYTVPRS